MTKQQYETAGKYAFLVFDDRMKQIRTNEKNSWGISESELNTLINKHRKAREAEDFYTMALIEYRLTDINFHSVVGFLMNGGYDNVLNTFKGDNP